MAAAGSTVQDVGADPDLDSLRGVASGRPDACRRLVERHLQPLHAFAARLLDDPTEAEDVCQEAFLKLWQMAPDWKPGKARVATWLYQVAINGCRDRLRKRRPTAEVDFDAAPSNDAGPEQQQELRDRGRHLQRVLASLPERQREALLLFHFEGHSQGETADILQVSVDALESLLARARRSIKEHVAHSNEEGR